MLTPDSNSRTVCSKYYDGEFCYQKYDSIPNNTSITEEDSIQNLTDCLNQMGNDSRAIELKLRIVETVTTAVTQVNELRQVHDYFGVVGGTIKVIDQRLKEQTQEIAKTCQNYQKGREHTYQKPYNSMQKFEQKMEELNN